MRRRQAIVGVEMGVKSCAEPSVTVLNAWKRDMRALS